MITINSNTESNYEISICAKCSKEWYTIHYQQHGCTCLSEKERKKIERQKQNWRNMQARAAKKARLKRLELKGSKTPVFEKKTPQKPINKISEKQKQETAELNRLKNQLKDVAEKSGRIECKGCLIYFKRSDIQASHKTSIGADYSQRKDKWNLTLMCADCHQVFENGKIEDRIKLHCFESEMKYLYSHNYNKFSKIFDLILDYSNKNKYPSVLKLLKKIENFEEIEAI